jgi:type II secretory pathway component PulM
MEAERAERAEAEAEHQRQLAAELAEVRAEIAALRDALGQSGAPATDEARPNSHRDRPPDG